MKCKVIVVALVLASFAHGVSAQSWVSEYNSQDVISAFRTKAVIDVGPIVVPTVVDVPIPRNIDPRQEFIVIETGTDMVVPSYVMQSSESVERTLMVQTSGEGYLLSDGNYSSAVRYDLPPQGSGQAVIEIATDEPVTASQINLLVGKNSPLPNTVTIEAYTGETWLTVRAPDWYVASELIPFIPTTAQQWRISFSYSQPLLIGEIELVEDNPEQIYTNTLRFLAQPNRAYTVYAYPDRFVSVPYGEGGNLYYETDVLRLANPAFYPNERYVEADIDGDTISDARDNCIAVSNPDQMDIDRNGRGDVCDDFDRDGLINSQDNCQNLPNANQSDEDGDGIGDVCDDAESRLTERLPWVPWVGMGLAAVVLVGLFTIVARRPLGQPKAVHEESTKEL